MEETTEPAIPRHAKGKRPTFFEVDGVDEAMSMILVLASEFCVMRDRLDTVEKIATAKGIMIDEEVDSFEPDEATILAREERRKAFLDRLYYVTLKKAKEQEQDDSGARYSAVLEEIAEG